MPGIGTDGDFSIDYDAFDLLLQINPIVIPPDTGTAVETDATAEVIDGSGTSTAATSLSYRRSGLIDIAWAQEPYRTLWSVRSDGLLLGMTYRRDQGVLAWHRHPMTNGAVESICVIPDPTSGRSQLWMAVQREVNGSTVRYIEYMTDIHEPSNPTDTGGYVFLDSSLTYSGSAVSSVSGLEHLEGQTVQIWADGIRHADKTVSGGSVTLDRSASTVTVGIHTTSYILTLPANAGAANGTAQGKQKQVARARVRVHETIGGKMGRDLDALDDLNVRRSSGAMDTTPALVSGVSQTLMDAAHDREAQFIVAQDYPAPMTITALMPEIDGTDY